MTDLTRNQLRLTGVLFERDAVRYTPAGVPVCEAKLRHQGEVVEAGGKRSIELEIAVKALGDTARWLASAPLGQSVGITGFLAPRSRNSRQLVLHVDTIEYLEGIENGQTVSEEKEG